MCNKLPPKRKKSLAREERELAWDELARDGRGHRGPGQGSREARRLERSAEGEGGDCTVGEAEANEKQDSGPRGATWKTFIECWSFRKDGAQRVRLNGLAVWIRRPVRPVQDGNTKGHLRDAFTW